MSWDCERAGVEGSPLSALCGETFRTAHTVVLRLAGYEGIGKECGWPVRKTLRKELDEVVASGGTPDRIAFLRTAFEDALAKNKGVRTQNPGYDCAGYRQKVGKLVEESLTEWRATKGQANKGK
jgi:hypothetical protein